MSLETISKKILNSNKMIYFLSGGKNQELLETFNRQYADVMKITKDTITPQYQDGNDSDFDTYVKKITLQFLITKHFVMDLSEYKLLNDGDLKSFLHNEYLYVAYSLLGLKPNSKSNKLFVLIDNVNDVKDLSGSILRRSKFIDTYEFTDTDNI